MHCTIVVERLADGSYRASCPQFADCQAVAPTEAAARAAVENALERLQRDRMINPIDDLFQRLRTKKQKAFIPFITAGDPDLAATARIAKTLAEQGAHLLEIGFPYSDPIADGPVIQASYMRALSKGLRLDAILGCVKQVSASLTIPLAGMIAYALVHRRGAERFVNEAKEAGLSGLIVPDLPVEEAQALLGLCTQRDLKLIQLITPTTPRDRAKRIAQTSTGFIYYVSITGITGERDQLPDELLTQLRWLRGETDLPICVGFGISKPEHVRMLRDCVDGVIVGSALVRKLEHGGTRSIDEIARDIGGLAKSLASALNP